MACQAVKVPGISPSPGASYGSIAYFWEKVYKSAF